MDACGGSESAMCSRMIDCDIRDNILVNMY